MKNLKDTSYIDLNENDNSWSTLKLSNFVENQRSKLEAEKQIVNEQWRKYVENILKENKIYKDQLILYFKSVSGLMSSQLRKIIIGSIERYYNFMKQFKKDQYYSAEEIFNYQYDPKYPFQRSFIEVDIKEHPSGEQFTFSEELNDIHAKLTNVVKDIIKYSQNVERPDNMFIKNVDKHANLWQVPFIDSVVTKMYSEIDVVINENLEVINEQLAMKQNQKRKMLVNTLIVTDVCLIILFILLAILGSPYQSWDYSDPEWSVIGTLWHSFEWVYFKVAPLMVIVITAILGIIFVKRNK